MSNTSLFTTSLTTALGVGSTVSDIKARADASVRNVESMAESYLFSQRVGQQQLKDLDRAVSDKMSASGLEALKTEARLKAASAETGTTASQEVIQQGNVQKLHEDAALLRTYEVQKHSQKQQMVAETLSFENAVESEVSGMQSGTSAFLQTLSAGFSGFQSGLNLLSTSEQESVLGVNHSDNTDSMWSIS